jgi:hypothetical protein
MRRKYLRNYRKNRIKDFGVINLKAGRFYRPLFINTTPQNVAKEIKSSIPEDQLFEIKRGYFSATSFSCRGEKTRTSDHLHPMQVR